MLVWINGPFGGGKTHVAHELHRRLEGSVICDPEEVGFGLHRMMPARLRGDFQDLAAWRTGTCEVLDRVLTDNAATVLVPMTVVRPEYFDETVGRLRARGHDVRHFALLADRDVVARRLRRRGFGSPRRESFALARLDVCLRRLRQPEFAEHIWTDHLTVAQVADHIAASVGLTIAPNTDGNLRGRARRGWVAVRHLRLG
jgi:hypothetical protein